MPPIRDLEELVPKLAVVIPDPVLRQEFLRRTKPILSSVRFTAPECMYMRWHDLSDVMISLFGMYRQANPPWLEELRETFAGTR